MRHIIGLICLAAFFALLITGCSKAPGSVIEDFYNAKTWDERKAFILDANGLKEEDVLKPNDSFFEMRFLRKLDENTSLYSATIKNTDDNGYEKKRDQKFLIKKIEDIEKIDFKTMIGYNDMSLSDYITTKNTGPQRFWVYLRRNDYISVLGSIYWVYEIDEIKHSESASILFPFHEEPEEFVKWKSESPKPIEADEKEMYLVLLEISGEIHKLEEFFIPNAIMKPWSQVKFIQYSPLWPKK